MPRMTNRRAGRPPESQSGRKVSLTIRLTQEQFTAMKTIASRFEIRPSESQLIGWVLEKEAREQK